MPLTAAQGYKIREEYSDIKEKAICDAHGLRQIGGSRTKVDGTDGNVSKSIKNASGSSTQVHLTTQKHFIETLKITVMLLSLLSISVVVLIMIIKVVIVDLLKK